ARSVPPPPHQREEEERAREHVEGSKCETDPAAGAMPFVRYHPVDTANGPRRNLGLCASRSGENVLPNRTRQTTVSPPFRRPICTNGTLPTVSVPSASQLAPFVQ